MKLVLTALVLFCASSSFAANAVSDPVVASLRARFSKAFVPTAQQLRLGKTWNCREFSASPNGSGSKTTEKTFRAFDGLYEMAYNGEDFNSAFVAASQGLVSTDAFEDLNSHEVVRIDSKGNLLIEKSAQLKANAGKYTKAVYEAFDKAVALSNDVATNYGVCVVK